MSDPAVEVLEGTPLRRPGRRWSRRGVIVVAAVALMLGATAFVVDQRSREQEKQALDRCARDAVAAVDEAYAPVAAMWNYVRPALDGGASPAVRESLRELLADSVTGRAALVAGARDACAQVHVAWLHDDLASRRDRCVRLLDEHGDFLEQGARAGSLLSGPWPHRIDDC